MEAHVGNRTLFVVHGDQCAHIKGQYFVERIQINMIDICSSTLYLISFQLVVVIMGEGVTPSLHVCQDHYNSAVS